MGDSFGDVQIHTGAQAAAACESINARAFTVGNNIAFNSGEYDPESEKGQHVLAHELAHVRQQTGGAVSMLPQEDLELEIDPDPALEREAEETAQRVMAGGELGIQRLRETEVHVQRYVGSRREGDPQETNVDALKGLGKDAALGLMGELPGGTLASKMLEGMNDRATRLDQLESDLKELGPPDSWIREIENRLTFGFEEGRTDSSRFDIPENQTELDRFE